MRAILPDRLPSPCNRRWLQLNGRSTGRSVGPTAGYTGRGQIRGRARFRTPGVLTPTRSDPRHTSYGLHALFGVCATLFGMAAAHVVAALTVPAASPVLAVGSTVIDLTPTPMKEWAVRQFGTADKPILIGSVLVAVLLLAALAGVVTARRPTLGLMILVGLAAVAGVAAALRPSAGPLDVVPALVAAVTGSGALWWLHRLDGLRGDGSAGEGGAGTEATQGFGAPSRRGGVLATGGQAAAAVAQGARGRWVSCPCTRTDR